MTFPKAGKSRVKKSFDIAVSVAVGLVMATFVLFMWQSYESNIHLSRKNKIDLTGQFISNQLKSIITNDIRYLSNLRDRIEVTGGDYLKYWDFDASLIIEQNPSFEFVEWIDSNMVIQKIQPEKGNEPAIGLDISKVPYRRSQWRQSAEDSSINITEWAKLTQGGESFLVDAPVYYKGTFQGTITAGLVFNKHFDEVMVTRENLCLNLYDHKGVLFYSWGDYGLINKDQGYIYRTEIPVTADRNQKWVLELGPGVTFFESNIWFERKLGLVLGVLIALLMAVTLYLLLRSSREQRRISIINHQLHQLNEDLKKEKKKAESASRAKSEFLSNMSHEIRTPLNAILGLLDIVKRQLPGGNAEIQKYLEMMTFSSKNLLGLVNDVLEIERIEAGKVDLVERTFQPLEEVKLLQKLYQPLFEEKSLYLNLIHENEEGYTMLGDSLKFNQILTNLLRNAFKFTHKGGVEMSYSELITGNEATVIVEISDTGIGIPEEKLKRIFERFSQVETGYTRKFEGTGLGLAISRMLIEAMGGSIEVKSQPGAGSVFTIRVNFKIESRTNHESDAPRFPEEGYRGSRVLVVEDNPMNVLVLTKLLEQFEIFADVAGTGAEAVEMCAANQYDLIFMDIHMPEMDGHEATRKLRAAGCSCPVVALSANITKASVQEAREAGMQDYITKPFTREAIMKVLKQHLS